MAHEAFVRKLQRVGSHSYSINVPKEIVDEFSWRERQKLVIKKNGERLIIEDWKR